MAVHIKPEDHGDIPMHLPSVNLFSSVARYVRCITKRFNIVKKKLKCFYQCFIKHELVFRYFCNFSTYTAWTRND